MSSAPEWVATASARVIPQRRATSSRSAPSYVVGSSTSGPTRSADPPAGTHRDEVVARRLEVGHAVEEHRAGAGHQVRAGQVAAQVGVQERHLGGQRELDQEGVGPGREHLHVTQYSRPALAGRGHDPATMTGKAERGPAMV